MKMWCPAGYTMKSTLFISIAAFVITLIGSCIQMGFSHEVDVDLGVPVSSLRLPDKVLWSLPLATVVGVAVFIVGALVVGLNLLMGRRKRRRNDRSP